MEINNPQKNLNIDENTISTKRYQLFDNLDEISLIKEKNNSKISLRKKKNTEYITKIRKGKIKKLELYLNLNNTINYDELFKEIPKEIISEFTSTKNKYSFFIKYLSLTEKDDPNFYLRMFVIYQIHVLSYNDITNSSLPSKELLDWLIKYLLFYEYNNDQMHQKIQIQSEIIQMLIIWVSYIKEDNSNSVLYDDHFIFQLMDLIDSDIYNVEFKINILHFPSKGSSVRQKDYPTRVPLPVQVPPQADSGLRQDRSPRPDGPYGAGSRCKRSRTRPDRGQHLRQGGRRERSRAHLPPLLLPRRQHRPEARRLPIPEVLLPRGNGRTGRSHGLP